MIVLVDDTLKDVILEELDGSPPPHDLSRIVGIFRNPDRVTSENFHEYLYGDRGGER